MNIRTAPLGELIGDLLKAQRNLTIHETAQATGTEVNLERMEQMKMVILVTRSEIERRVKVGERLLLACHEALLFLQTGTQEAEILMDAITQAEGDGVK